MQDIRVLEVSDGEVRMRVGAIEAVFGFVPGKNRKRSRLRILVAYKEGAQAGGEQAYIPTALYRRAIRQAGAILHDRRKNTI